MPDIRQGYGFPIGVVIATRLPEGVISPRALEALAACLTPVQRPAGASREHVRARSMSGLAEEVASAYKDVSRVLEVVEGAGIGRNLAGLEPIAVLKG